MNQKVSVFEIAVIGVVLALTAICLTTNLRDVGDVPESRFVIHVDDGYEVDTYYCDEVRVGNGFVTLWECEGYEGEVELVGGMDWEEVRVEVNE